MMQQTLHAPLAEAEHTLAYSLTISSHTCDPYIQCREHDHVPARAGLQKQKRAEHKFQKKIPRTKGNRGQLKEGGTYDGSALHYGRRGGLVRVHVAQTVT